MAKEYHIIGAIVQAEEDRKRLKELCELQDKYLEHVPKEMDNRTVGMLLEENMDILRELCCRRWPDGGYIREKTCKMLKDLKDLGFNVPQCEEKRHLK